TTREGPLSAQPNEGDDENEKDGKENVNERDGINKCKIARDAENECSRVDVLEGEINQHTKEGNPKSNCGESGERGKDGGEPAREIGVGVSFANEANDPRDRFKRNDGEHKSNQNQGQDKGRDSTLQDLVLHPPRARR